MNSSKLCERLMSLGVTKVAASAIISQIDNWYKSSGKQWTVKRLKEIKQLFLSQMAGTPYSGEMYISLNSEGYPKGPISYLFRRFSNKQLSKLLTALSSYTAFEEVTPTKEQINKFFGALEDISEKGLSSTLRIIPKELTSSRKPGRPPTLPEYCVRNTRAPGPDGTMVSETDYISCATAAAKSNPIRRLIAEFDTIFEDVIPVDSLLNIEPSPTKSDKGDSLAHYHTFGVLSGIQEPGLKLRVIANPCRVIQCALEPLKDELGRVLESIPEDCTFDQGKAIPRIQGWLKEGRVVHSIDLSDATTRFPWFVTKGYLLKAFPKFKDFIDIMDRVSTGPWRSSIRTPNEVVTFYRGQPLGLGPSFFAFALTHHCVVRGLASKLGIDPAHQYFILGDDIVIVNDQLAHAYRQTMLNLGNKISEQKSMVSNKVAEFAGYVIMPDTFGKGMKWRSWTDHSVLDHVRFLGKKMLPFLTKQQRALVKLVASVPKWAGGLGWSGGRTLDSYIETNDGKAFLESYIIGLEQRLSSNVTQENLGYHLRTLRFVLDELSAGNPLRDYILKRIPDEDWRQSSSTAYRFGRDKDMLKPLSHEAPVRVFGPRQPGYFPTIKRGGDPRPTILSWALVLYQARVKAGMPKSKLIQGVFENYFKRPYAEIVYEYNSYKEWKLAPSQTKPNHLKKAGGVKPSSPKSHSRSESGEDLTEFPSQYRGRRR